MVMIFLDFNKITIWYKYTCYYICSQIRVNGLFNQELEQGIFLLFVDSCCVKFEIPYFTASVIQVILLLNSTILDIIFITYISW